MGNFYTSITLRGPSQDEVAAELAGREALVSPMVDDCVAVFDAESEDQNPKVLAKLASTLSREFNCPALAVLNHDDDVLWYVLFDGGKQHDEYDSSPGFEGGDPDAAPKGGDASVLCAAFGSSSVAAVNKVLRATRDNYTFAVERHADLVAALGLPEWLPGAGFNYLSEGEFPEGLEEDSLVATK